MDAQPPRIPRLGNRKPDFAPSYTLHVLPSQFEGTGNFDGMDFWSLRGFDLKGVISVVYDLNPVRIDLSAFLDDGKRYDFSLVLPELEDEERMRERFQQGIQDHFHLDSMRDDRVMDVYVVTAPDRKPPALEPGPADDRMTLLNNSHIAFEIPKVRGNRDGAAAMPKAFNISAISSMSAEGTTDEFCRLLERKLDRPIVNETNLEGEFVFHVEPTQTAKNDFLDRLRHQLGLIIAPAQRNVEILAFKPR